MISPYFEQQKLKDRISELTQRKIKSDIRIVTDCPDFMNINGGDVYRIERQDFFILGDTYELRFGIGDQPKYWAKHAIDLTNGAHKIIKFIFYEEFVAHIGPLRIRCYRSPEKESEILNLVRGDKRFMQGITMQDQGGHTIRVIDFIKGKPLYAYIFDCELSHKTYYYQQVPWILKNILKSMEAIKFLHDNKQCHGDIRNDHIIIERETNQFRWIDFDLTQNYLDFDLWSIGNILNFILGKGIKTFYEVRRSNQYSQSIKDSLNSADAAAFYKYRIMNLKKLFPYISDKLSDILLHFTLNSNRFYENIENIIDDLNTAVSVLPNDKPDNCSSSQKEEK